MPSSAVNAPTPRASSTRSNLRRHALKCAICNHPDRAAIEFDFLNWRNPGDIVKGYHFRGLSTIYRHAHATGLFAKRRLNLRFAMERIVERVNEVPVTANAVIRAARAVSRINDAGEWVDPPSRLIVSHMDAEEAPKLERRKPAKTGKRAPRSPARGAWEIGRPRPAPIFDEILLDEPSDSASGELPRINGKPPEPEVILTITPEFARCREERRRAIEADLASRAATPPDSCNGVSDTDSLSGRGGTCPDRSVGSRNEKVCLGGRGFSPDIKPDSSPSSLLPQAALAKPAPASTAPSPAPESRGGIDAQSVALSPSLPQAAVENTAPSAPSGHEPRVTRHEPYPVHRHNGSSGSCDPPSPFTPEPLRRWKPRRRF